MQAFNKPFKKKFTFCEIIGRGETPLNISMALRGATSYPTLQHGKGTTVVGMDFQYGEPFYNTTPKSKIIEK